MRQQAYPGLAADQRDVRGKILEGLMTKVKQHRVKQSRMIIVRLGGTPGKERDSHLLRACYLLNAHYTAICLCELTPQQP